MSRTKGVAGVPAVRWTPDPGAQPTQIANDTPFGQRIRLAYIEARLFLDGEISTSVIRSNLSISRQQAHTDLHLYLQTYGTAASYNSSLKRWILDRRRKPKILEAENLGSFARYVESVRALAEKGSII